VVKWLIACVDASTSTETGVWLASLRKEEEKNTRSRKEHKKRFLNNYMFTRDVRLLCDPGNSTEFAQKNANSFVENLLSTICHAVGYVFEACR
jgi:hypothetical protein